MSKKWACLQCARPMKKKGRFCGPCKRNRPRAVKATTAHLTKAFGAAPKPVRAEAPKTAPAPRQAPGLPGYAAGPVSWDPDAREAARAVANGPLQCPGQAEILAGRMIAKAAGARTIREAWQAESDYERSELLRAAAIAAGEM